MRIVFMGSDELACPSLQVLAEKDSVELLTVMTEPDRPQGRRRHLAPCAAKAFAEEEGLPVWTPEKVGAPEVVERLAEWAPDLIVVVAYGQYLPERVLQTARLAAINLHPSLLPLYRGATPIQWAIANGETVTGVTILHVSEEMDAGDIILQEEVPIDDEDSSATLKPRLAEVGARMLSQAIARLAAGDAPRVPQDQTKATVVHKLTKQDGRVDWHLPAAVIRNRIRGFYPWPCCFTEVPLGSGQVLRLLKAEVLESGEEEPGVVLALDKAGPVVAAGEGALRLLEVQPQGKNPMSGRAYLNGHALAVGDRLGLPATWHPTP
jgi:methionyl-tRNA formyltransferase